MQRSIIAPAERVTNLRWGIALLLGSGILIGGLDRPAYVASAATNVTAIGTLTLVFGVVYALVQLLVGPLLDRFGVTLVGRIATVCWTLLALLPLAGGSFGTLLAERGALGIAETPNFPLSAKATGYWFPTVERSTATAIFDAAALFAVAIGAAFAGAAAVAGSRHVVALVTAGLSVLFCAAFFLFYRDPGTDRRLTYAERNHLATGGAQAEGEPANGSVTRTFFALLKEPKVWGLTIGYAAQTFAVTAPLLWLPLYLEQQLHVTPGAGGLSSALPWLVAAIADLLVGGVLVDALVRRGADATRTRKIVLVGGMLLSLAVFGMATLHDRSIAIACTAIAFAGLGAARPIAWSIPALIAPRGAVGSVASIMRFAGIVAGAAALVFARNVVNQSGGLSAELVVTAAVLVAGILSYVFLLGRIEAIPEPATGRG